MRKQKIRNRSVCFALQYSPDASLTKSTDTFLQINDQINTVLNRYEAFKKGDYSFSSNPIPVELGGSSAKNDLSLIDFDDSDPSNGGPPGGVNDLAGLFGSGPSTSSSSAPPNVNHATRPVSSHASSPQQQPQFGSIMLPGTPQPGASARGSRVGSPNSFEQGNGYGVLGGRSTSTVSIGMGVGSISPQQQPQPQQQAGVHATSTNQAKGKDPFADLVGLF